MKKDIIFISDLHLCLEQPAITRRFLKFLAGEGQRAATIYILGDLFDAWVGDDDNSYPGNKIKSQLKQLTASGTKIYLQLGNRDFLLGAQFASDSGVILLADYEVIQLNGVATLLMHGDLLCSDDIAYQAFRQKSHQPDWQQNVLAKPLWLRLLAARWYRFRSLLHKIRKSEDIMDVSQQEVLAVLQKHRCYRLIHGHTHRPAVHNFRLNGKPAQRFVLADWNKNAGHLLRWNEDGYSVEII